MASSSSHDFDLLVSFMIKKLKQALKNERGEQASARKKTPGGEERVPTPSCLAREGEGASNPCRQVDLEAKEDQNCEGQQQMGDFQQPEEGQTALVPSCLTREGKGASNPRRQRDLEANEGQICEEQQQISDFQQPEEEIIALVPSYLTKEGKGAPIPPRKVDFEVEEHQMDDFQQQVGDFQQQICSFQHPMKKGDSQDQVLVMPKEGWNPKEGERGDMEGMGSGGYNPSHLLPLAQPEVTYELERSRKGRKEICDLENIRFDSQNLEIPDSEDYVGICDLENIRFDSQNLEIPDSEDYVGPNRIFVGSNPLFDEGAPQGEGGTSRHPLVGAQGHPPWLNKPPDPPGQQQFQPLQQPLEAPLHLYEGQNESMVVQQDSSHVSKVVPPYLHPQIDHLPPQERETGQLVQQYFKPLQQPLEASLHLYEGSNASMEGQHTTSHVSNEAPPYFHPPSYYLPPQNRETVQFVVLEQQHEDQTCLNRGSNMGVEVHPDPTHLGYGASPYLHPNNDYGAPPGCIDQQQLLPHQKQFEAHQQQYGGSDASLEVQHNTSNFGKGDPPYLHPKIGYVPPHVRDFLLSLELNQQQVPPGGDSITTLVVHKNPSPINNGAPPYWHPTNQYGHQWDAFLCSLLASNNSRYFHSGSTTTTSWSLSGVD